MDAPLYDFICSHRSVYGTEKVLAYGFGHNMISRFPRRYPH